MKKLIALTLIVATALSMQGACLGAEPADPSEDAPDEDDGDLDKSAAEVEWFALGAAEEDKDNSINALNRIFTPCVDMNPLSISCKQSDSQFSNETINADKKGSYLVKGIWTVKEEREYLLLEGAVLLVMLPLANVWALVTWQPDMGYEPFQYGSLAVRGMFKLAYGQGFNERRATEGDYYVLSADNGWKRANRNGHGKATPVLPSDVDPEIRTRFDAQRANGVIVVFGNLRGSKLFVKDIFLRDALIL